ncbi:hypothetical protein VPH35_120403 [Triticum aestivum]
MAKAPVHPRGWRTKRYILAALMVTLAVTAVVIAVSAVLRPARIVFSVTGAVAGKLDRKSKTRQLNLTLSANNTSHRAGVKYSSVIVYLQFKSNGTEYKLGAGPASPPWHWQPPGATVSMSQSGTLFGTALDIGPSGRAPAIGVLVLAVVKYRVGPAAYTRPYDVRVLGGGGAVAGLLQRGGSGFAGLRWARPGLGGLVCHCGRVRLAPATMLEAEASRTMVEEVVPFDAAQVMPLPISGAPLSIL